MLKFRALKDGIEKADSDDGSFSRSARKSILERAQEQNGGSTETKPRISKRVSIKEDLENRSPSDYKIFKPELVKKLSNKSFDESDDSIGKV